MIQIPPRRLSRDIHDCFVLDVFPHRHTTETTYDELWSESIPVEPRRLLMTRGITTIPVDISIPDDRPECALDENGNGTRWVLRVHGLIEGRPGFSFQFEVPFYRRR